MSSNGISIFAAPVFNAGGICAALAVLGTTAILPLANSSKEAALLMETAQEITDLMGGVWPSAEEPLG